MSAHHTPGPWYVLDQRATTLRAQGLSGLGDHDVLLISNYAPADIRPDHCDCIVARIEMANRPEQLSESNYRDAILIAEAPTLVVELESAAHALEEASKLLFAKGLQGTASIIMGHADRARAAIAKARGL